MAARLDPLLSALNEDYINDLPTSQSIANAAIIAIFAYLVPLLTMEINYFRFAVYKSWRRGNLRIAQRELKKQNRKEKSGHGSSDDCIVDDRFVINNEAGMNGADKGADIIAAHIDDDEDDDDDDTSAVGYLLNDVSSALHDLPARMSGVASRSPSAATLSIQEHISVTNNVESLYEAYKIIRQSSMYAIFTSLLVYTLTAIGISLNTRGLDPKVIAIIIGASQFMTALMVFIVSAKIPQWIGVYHAGAIRLVKCSSIYSQQFESLHYLDHNTSSSSNNSSYLAKLSWNVKLGVWFHFAKFYIILMPFYCGVQKLTIPLSIICGAVFGFILMWAVFVVHEKYIHHRNIVSFTTILLLSIISALTFTRGMAWMQVVWKLGILENEDALMVISFFTWLGILAVVHALFIWHTLRTEENEKKKMGSNTDNTEEVVVSEEVANAEATDGDVSNHTTGQSNPKKKAMRRNSSYDSFLFDPRTHFVDGKKCQFAEHPDLDDDSFRTNEMTDGILSNPSPTNDDARKEEDEEQGGEHQVNADCRDDDDDDAVHLGEGFCIETPVVADTGNSVEPKFDDDDIDNNESGPNSSDKEEGNDVIDDPTTPQPDFAAPQVIVSDTPQKKKEKRRRPICCRLACCANFICFSPEYAQSSCLWKSIAWTKIIVMVLTYLLCLYFIAVSIGATIQQNSVREALPAVQEALYNHMNEGPVCAFDNRGADSNITTFPDKEAAHEAGFLVVHCGACGACSSWENLIIEYTTRDSMAAAANECAKKALFGGGDDALTECLMEPPIGFGYECALCWMEDILCTKEHCSFIFLQSQMINNVGNFAVGDDEVTSATCEEAHCEVGQFVPCSGATRRRMNITSSISRPGDQQCAIVDVESWEDLFFGSGIAL